jgi:hypothetical protein
MNVADDLPATLEFETVSFRTTSTRPRSYEYSYCWTSIPLSLSSRVVHAMHPSQPRAVAALSRRILARAMGRCRSHDHVDASSYEPPMEHQELLYTHSMLAMQLADRTVNTSRQHDVVTPRPSSSPITSRVASRVSLIVTTPSRAASTAFPF